MYLTNDKILLKNWKNIKFHLVFWCAFIGYEVSLYTFFTKNWGNFWDYALHYGVDIGLFYFHAHYTLKKIKKSIGLNLIWLFLEIGVCYGINLLIILSAPIFEIQLQYPKVNTLFFLATAYRLVFILLISTAYWYMLQRIESLKKIQEQQQLLFETELKNKALENGMLEAQLSKQKASIVPHFLFNTLHILYHQLRKDKPLEAQHLLSLSEMMQYNLSPLDQQYKIPLSDELRYLQNYIELRQLERHYELRLNLQVSESEADELLIIPLVLATLIENVFHHGDLYDAHQPALIGIVLNKQKQLRIFIKNKIKYPLSTKNGIGIANMLSRLAHFYPGQHEYSSKRSSRSYTQKLSIQLAYD